MKNKKHLVTLFALSALVSMSCLCGLSTLTDKFINQAAGGDQGFQSVSTLWSDVPQMDGMEPSPIGDMPPFVKLAMRFALGNMGKLNSPGEDQTTGNIDWIAFTSDKTPQDVQNFYTNDLMVANGWDTNDTPCFSGSDQGNTEVGVVCVFGKTEATKSTQLAIITSEDTTTKKTNIFYLRVEENATPVPGATP